MSDAAYWVDNNSSANVIQPKGTSAGDISFDQKTADEIKRIFQDFADIDKWYGPGGKIPGFDYDKIVRKISATYFESDTEAANSNFFNWYRKQFVYLFNNFSRTKRLLNRPSDYAGLDQVDKVELVYSLLSKPSNLFRFLFLYWQTFWSTLWKRRVFHKLYKEETYQKI